RAAIDVRRPDVQYEAVLALEETRDRAKRAAVGVLADQGARLRADRPELRRVANAAPRLGGQRREKTASTGGGGAIWDAAEDRDSVFVRAPQFAAACFDDGLSGSGHRSPPRVVRHPAARPGVAKHRPDDTR